MKCIYKIFEENSPLVSVGAAMDWVETVDTSNKRVVGVNFITHPIYENAVTAIITYEDITEDKQID